MNIYFNYFDFLLKNNVINKKIFFIKKDYK
jgi:hypothetical protein